jgi:uncharacterized membrane protein
MKVRITSLYLGMGLVRYVVKRKEHWWCRWHYIMDGQHPRLFSKEELNLIWTEKKLKKNLQ